MVRYHIWFCIINSLSFMYWNINYLLSYDFYVNWISYNFFTIHYEFKYIYVNYGLNNYQI
jgi:hypothetical protein